MSVGVNIFLESDVLSQLPLLKRFRSGCGLRYFEQFEFDWVSVGNFNSDRFFFILVYTSIIKHAYLHICNLLCEILYSISRQINK